MRWAKGPGRIFRGAFATSDASRRSKGSNAPTGRLAHILSFWAVVVAATALSAASASAASYPLLETFGSAAQPTFGSAAGLAVDQSSGELLVIDAEADTVSRWNPD